MYWRFWQSLGAGLFLYSSVFLPSVRGFFSNWIMQYLGRISFSLYLMHKIPECVISARLVFALGWKIEYDFKIALAVYFFVQLPLAIWVGDVFERSVDVPCVRFVRYMERKVVM